MPSYDLTKDKGSKPLSPYIFISLSALIFIRPLFSGLAYPLLEFYYENCVIFLAIVTLIIVAASFGLRKISEPKGFDYLIFLLFLAYIFSSMSSINIQNSIKETIKFISYISIFFIVSQTDSNQKNTLIKTIIVSATIISIYSIYQYFWGYRHTIEYLKKINSDLLLNSSYARDILIAKRSIGTFPSPNIFGSYLIMVFFLPLSLIQGGALDKHYPRLHPGHIGLALITIALIFTKSLGAWLSLTASLIILLVLSYESIKYKKLMLATFLIVILIAISFIFITRWERLTNLNDPQNSITQRLNYWRTAIAVIKDHPLFGIGPGNFQEVFLKYKVGLSTDTRYAHNIFLHIWSETGLLGLIGMLFLITASLTRSLHSYKYIFLSLLVFLFHNLIDNSYFIPEVGIFWWVLLGLVSKD